MQLFIFGSFRGPDIRRRLATKMAKNWRAGKLILTKIAISRIVPGCPTPLLQFPPIEATKPARYPGKRCRAARLLSTFSSLLVRVKVWGWDSRLITYWPARSPLNAHGTRSMLTLIQLVVRLFASLLREHRRCCARRAMRAW